MMYEIFQSVLLGVALVGLALALVVLAARSRTLNLVEPVVVTNIPNAYDAVYYESFTNQSSLWTFWNIVDLQSSTRGLECYFINTFSDSSDTLAANSSKGMIITREAEIQCIIKSGVIQ